MDSTGLQIADRAAAELFTEHAATFGRELDTYRGHVHRVIGLINMQGAITDDLAVPVGVAAFYHDAAIWFDNTWDYLPQSAQRAVAELGTAGAQHGDLVVAMIDEHHRIRRARHHHPLVEAFRVADRYDVYFGLAPARGVTRKAYRELRREYPTAGFRPMLMRAFGRGLRENPLRPMPMIKF